LYYRLTDLLHRQERFCLGVGEIVTACVTINHLTIRIIILNHIVKLN